MVVEEQNSIRESAGAPEEPPVSQISCEDAPPNIASAAEVVFFNETLQLALVDSPPREHSQAKSLGWRDISKPSAKLYHKTKSNPSGDCIFLCICSQDQVPKLPLLTLQDSGHGHVVNLIASRSSDRIQPRRFGLIIIIGQGQRLSA